MRIAVFGSTGSRPSHVVGRPVPDGDQFQEARQADAAVVLFTPDEEVAAVLDADGRAINTDDIRARARARQNVSVEFGWFWALLGREQRKSGRVPEDDRSLRRVGPTALRSP